MPGMPITLNGRKLRPHKAIVTPLFQSRSVLTREPWSYVRLSLKRENETKALFYWEQAKIFHDASNGLPLESAPLLLYYAYLNAAKALLTAKKVTFSPYHGVQEWKTGAAGRDCLKKEGVVLKTNGVLSSLAAYLGDEELSRKHSLQELFFNMPFIHRTYCLTYKGQRDMFVPLCDCVFVCDSASRQAYLSAKVSKDHLLARIVRRLPTSLVIDPAAGPSMIRSRIAVQLSESHSPTVADLNALVGLHRQLRADLFYINGAQTLWYVKLITKGPTRLERHCSTLILAAMHRLSELCRYHPMDFTSYLDGPANWLLHEFISMASDQYIDEIASELTGHQFFVPNVRPAS